MDPARDIRAIHQGSGESAWRDISGHLREYGPPEVPVGLLGNTSGLDCLIQVIRHTNSMLKKHTRDPEEDQNPILAYSWQNFDFSDLEEDSDDDLHDKVWLLNQLKGRFPTLSFSNLFKSKLMNETLWSMPNWILYTLYLTPVGQNKLFMYDVPSREEAGRRGCLSYDCSGDSQKSLQQFIDSVFNPQVHVSDIPISQKPSIARIAYTSNPTDPWPFTALKTFDMPVMDEEDEDFKYGPPTKLEHYVLVAVVRNAGDGISNDMVRTYNLKCEPVQMAEFPESYTSDSWSLSDPGGVRYHLFYGKSLVRLAGDAPEIPDHEQGMYSPIESPPPSGL